MSRFLRLVTPVFVVAALVALAGPATAASDPDVHSKNMRHLANSVNPFFFKDDSLISSDLAFKGNLLIAGTYGGPRFIDISDPADPRQITAFPCHGGQGDVSVYRNLLFLSVDADQDKPTCDSSDTPYGFEGIRILDISNPAKPKFVTGVQTDCGSHTHTLVPDPKHDAVYLYVESYPLRGQDESCNFHTHDSVVKVPLSNPRKASVSTFDTAPSQGCHDVTVFLPLKIAAAACLDEGQIWDISNPAKPVVKEHIYNPQIQIWHSAAFSNDGKTLVFGDEAFGGTGPGCAFSDMGWGRLWFYKTSDPSQPVGSFSWQRGQDKEVCTAHNFNVIPVQGKDVLVACAYQGGTSVIDFTDPTKPNEVGYYQIQGKKPASEWSSYWYNGYIYSNDEERGVDVFSFTAPYVKNARTYGTLNPQTQTTRF